MAHNDTNLQDTASCPERQRRNIDDGEWTTFEIPSSLRRWDRWVSLSPAPLGEVAVLEWLVDSPNSACLVIDRGDSFGEGSRVQVDSFPQANRFSSASFNEAKLDEYLKLVDDRVAARLIIAKGLSPSRFKALQEHLNVTKEFGFSNYKRYRPKEDIDGMTLGLRPYFIGRWFRPVTVDLTAKGRTKGMYDSSTWGDRRGYWHCLGQESVFDNISDALPVAFDESIVVHYSVMGDRCPSTVLVLTDPVPRLEREQGRVEDQRPYQPHQLCTSDTEDRSTAALVWSDAVRNEPGPSHMLQLVVDSAFKVFLSDTTYLQCRLKRELESIRLHFIRETKRIENNLQACEETFSEMRSQLAALSDTATVFAMANTVLTSLYDLSQEPPPAMLASPLPPEDRFFPCSGAGSPGHIFTPRTYAKLYLQRNSSSPVDRYTQHIISQNTDLELTIADVSDSLRKDLSILASRKAIEETRSVTKLTELAFFFIPLAFSTSIFGMGFNELEGLSITVWIIVVATIMPCVYTIRLALSSATARQLLTRYANMTKRRRHIRDTREPGIHDYFLAFFQLVPFFFCFLFLASLILVAMAWTLFDLSRQARIAMTILHLIISAVYFPIVHLIVKIDVPSAGSDRRGALERIILFTRFWGLFTAFTVTGVAVSSAIWRRPEIAVDAKIVWSVAAWWPLGFALFLLFYTYLYVPRYDPHGLFFMYSRTAPTFIVPFWIRKPPGWGIPGWGI